MKKEKRSKNRWAMKIFLWFIIGVLFNGGLLLAQSGPHSVTPEVLVQEALSRNPEVKSRYYRWQSSQAAISPAGTLPDLQVGIALLNLPVNSFAFNQEPMTGKQFSLRQKIPFPGKLGLKSDLAQVQSEMEQAFYQEARNQLKAQVRLFYYELFYLTRALDVLEKNLDLLHQVREVAETRYSVGTGLQQDILRIQVELLKMEEQRENLLYRRGEINARLNELLNRRGSARIVPMDSLSIPVTNIPLDTLLVQAERYRPLVQAWELQTRQHEKRVALARKQYWPDFTLGVAYTRREKLVSGYAGVDFFSAWLTVDVPLYFWRKQRKQVEQQTLLQQTTRWNFRKVLNQVRAEIAVVYQDLQRNRRLVQLYREGILPQAEQSFRSDLSGYRTGKIDFLTLLNSQMVLFNYHQEYYRMVSNLHKQVARLSFLVGEDLPTK
jgi:outer membrane protein TolC